MIHAGILYAACVATSAAGVWLSGQLSIKWRSHLTCLLHARYCANIALFSLPTSPLSQIDNPDQRITAETAVLCDALASAARLAAGAPFRVLFYSYIAWQYLGFRGVFTAFLFFIVFAAVQKIAVLPLARTVVVQEKKEGDLRFLHLRLRERGPDVAASRGAAAELTSLDLSLHSALENQKLVVHWKTAVTAATKGTDYSGALLNYALVGAAVFSGAAAAAGASGSGGELAQFVSNASFASLSLIYSFTEMLDLGEQLSSLAALTARVVGLIEILPAGEDSLEDRTARNTGASHRNNTLTDNSSLYTTNNTNFSLKNDQEMHPSGFATMLYPPTSTVFLNNTVPMELSIHALGRDLQREVHEIFPESTRNHSISVPQRQLLCILTFQFAGGGRIDLSPDRSSPTISIAAAEMDRLLENYMRWEATLRTTLISCAKNSNFNEKIEIWCDSVDPRTGLPLHGTPSSSSSGQRWSEVAAARALLRYDRRDAGVCPLVVHPVHGTSAYPVSFFTNAPVAVVVEALSAMASVSTREAKDEESLFTTNSSGLLPSTSSSFLLSCQDLSFSTLDGRKPLISNLSLAVTSGQWVLISGPNGAGKSTLLRVLSRLHPPTAGNISYNNNNSNDDDLFADPGSAMLLPQRPLSAPGPTLWQQIAYPSTTKPSYHVLGSILNQVGLGYLVEQIGGDFTATGPYNYNTTDINTNRTSTQFSTFSQNNKTDDEIQEKWSSTLSPGEFQRIAIARLLFHRPRLALLDEPCSAMDDSSAKKLLGLVRAAGVTCITVAQDTEMYREMHAVHLKLDGSGAATTNNLI